MEWRLRLACSPEAPSRVQSAGTHSQHSRLLVAEGPATGRYCKLAPLHEALLQ